MATVQGLAPAPSISVSSILNYVKSLTIVQKLDLLQKVEKNGPKKLAQKMNLDLSLADELRQGLLEYLRGVYQQVSGTIERQVEKPIELSLPDFDLAARMDFINYILANKSQNVRRKTEMIDEIVGQNYKSQTLSRRVSKMALKDTVGGEGGSVRLGYASLRLLFALGKQLKKSARLNMAWLSERLYNTSTSYLSVVLSELKRAGTLENTAPGCYKLGNTKFYSISIPEDSELGLVNNTVYDLLELDAPGYPEAIATGESKTPPPDAPPPPPPPTKETPLPANEPSARISSPTDDQTMAAILRQKAAAKRNTVAKLLAQAEAMEKTADALME